MEARIRKKGLLHQSTIILMCVSLLVCLAMAATVLVSQRLAQDTAAEVVLKAHERIVEQIESYLNNMEQVAYSVAYSPSVQKVLTEDAEMMRVLSRVDELRSVFSGAFVYSPYIMGISLYDADRTYLISSGNVYEGIDTLNDRYADITQGTYSGADDKTNGKVSQILYVYPLFRTDTVLSRDMRRQGYLTFALNVAFLRSFLEQGDFYEDTTLVITDRENRVILDNRDMDDEQLMEQLASPQRNGVYFKTTLRKTGWTLHSMMPMSHISANMRPLLYLLWGTAALLLAMVLLMASFFRRSILRPLAELRRFMVDLPDAHKRLSLKKRPENELRETMRLLNEMLDTLEQKNDELILSRTKMLKEETARQQMEIIAYRNQINPHFLYNTLDCIRGIASVNDVPDIARISEALSAMFRYAVKGGDVVPLSDEVAYVRNYAEIIGYRFDNRIKIELDIDEKLYACRVIKLLLQPLVENAVLHGLEKKLGEGLIVITAKREGERLRFRVADNGCGLTQKRCGELNALLDGVRDVRAEETDAQSGVGLMNIARRLFLYYGRDYELTISAGESGGTVVQIVLKDGGEGANV